MIYIVDNGASHSDHEIYFVEARPEDRSAVDAFVRIGDYYSWSLISTVERVEWYDGEPMTLDEMRGMVARYWSADRWDREAERVGVNTLATAGIPRPEAT